MKFHCYLFVALQISLENKIACIIDVSDVSSTAGQSFVTVKDPLPFSYNAYP